jgi:PAS domain S-box-containing protein
MSERAEASGMPFLEDADETEALQRYRTLMSALDDGIYRLDAEGRFVAVNDAVVETTGYGREELLGEHFGMLLDGDDVSAIEREIERRLAGSDDRTELLAVTVRTADGDRIPCELRVNPVEDDGSFRGSTGVVRDLTDRERTDRQSGDRRPRDADRGEVVLDASPVGVVVRDADGAVTRVNERASAMLGVSEGEGLADERAEYHRYDEDGRPVPDESLFARVLETGEPVSDRVLRVEREDGDGRDGDQRNGDRRWLSVSAAPVSTDDAEVGRVVTTYEDVTAIKERERELETELGELLGRVTDAFYALDDQWRFTHANDRAEELIDYRGEGLVGKNFWEVFEWATDSKLGEEYRTAMETQESTAFEFYYPDPLDAWYEVHAYPSETGLSVYFRDITERKQRERELEESKRRYQALVEQFPNGAVALVDQDLRYRTIGGNPVNIVDATADEIEGRSVREALPSHVADLLAPKYEAALDGESSTFEAEINDSVYQFRFSPIRDDDGDVFAALGMSQDVTEHRETKRRLAESERRYRTLVEHFPNGGVGLFDEDLQYTVVGGSILDEVDVSAEEVVGQTVWERYPEELATKLGPKFRAALDGETNSFEFEFHDRYWLAHTVPVSDDEGDIFAGMLMVQDITERAEYEWKLKESERRYRTLAEYFPNGVVTLFDHDLEYTLAAGRGFDDIPVAPQDVEGKHFRDVWDEDIADALEPAFEAVLDGREQSVELEYVGREWVIHLVPITDERGEVFAGMTMAQDITDRREYQRQLEASERRYRALAENFPNGGVGVFDRDRRYTLVTGTMWDDIEPDASDVEGNTVREALPPDTAADVEPVFRAALDGETGSVVSTLDGRTYRVWATPLRDADGEITAGQSFALDITERIERERKLEETVEKLEASNERLESFASMLAHELRNPVTIGQIYSQQLATEDDSEAAEYVTEAFDRIEEMIDVMLVLTRGREAVGDSSQLSLADAARDAWLELDAPETTLSVEVDETIRADETYLRHLFRNLFENAIQHGDADVIRVGETSTGFYVADDGTGISEENEDVVFEAGFTTAADEGGTGLGLAFVQELADVYEWACAVSDSETGGARFEFRDVNRSPES